MNEQSKTGGGEIAGVALRLLILLVLCVWAFWPEVRQIASAAFRKLTGPLANPPRPNILSPSGLMDDQSLPTPPPRVPMIKESLKNAPILSDESKQGIKKQFNKLLCALPLFLSILPPGKKFIS